MLGVVYLCRAASGTAIAHGPAFGPTAPSEAATPATQSPGEQAALPKNLADALARITNSLDGAEKALQHLNNVEEELGTLRIDVKTSWRMPPRRPRRCGRSSPPCKSQIEKLGPAAGQGCARPRRRRLPPSGRG